MSSDVRNYNVSFEVFLSAIEEYDQFISGLNNGIFKSYNLDSDTGDEEDEEEDKTKEIMARLLDRTVAAHSVLGMEKVLEDFKLLHRSNVILSCYNGISISDIKFNQTVMSFESDKFTPTDLISVENFVDNAESSSNIELNKASSVSEIDKFSKPTISTHVIRKSQYSPSNKQAKHLPIFLGAISDIEMSRCTPFIDIKFIHPKKFSVLAGQETQKLSYSRFFQYGASDTFTNPLPLNSTITDESETSFDNFSYMNLFTAPQTMVNANINSENNSVGSILGTVSSLFSDEDEIVSLEDARVLDPFQPFLSLISLDIVEGDAGIGGLFSTKTATLNLKLHDKTRIKELSPMLAVDEFATSKFVIEYGWSHPDSNITSNNTIGKYINNLRNISTYAVSNVSYSFGDDNTVDITMSLATAGAGSVIPRVSSGAGSYQSLRVFKGLIDLAISSFNENRKNPNLQQKVTEVQENMSSPSRLIAFEKIKDIKELANNVDITSQTARVDFYNSLREKLGGDGSPDSSSIDELENFMSEGTAFDRKWISLASQPDPFQFATRYEDEITTEFWETGEAYGAGDKQPNPSLTNFYPDLATSDGGGGRSHVSLGKLISKFVALPLSTCGTYDEIQVYFYPVNHQAGAARIHTTASIPINITAFKEMIDKDLQGTGSSERAESRKLTVEGFIQKCQTYLQDKSITAYEIQQDHSVSESNQSQSIESLLKKFRADSREDKLAYLKDLPSEDPKVVPASDIANVTWRYHFDVGDIAGAAEEVRKELEDEAIDDFEKGIAMLGQNQTRKVSNAYRSDGVAMVASDGIFQKIELEVSFEVTPVVDEVSLGKADFGSILTPFIDLFGDNAAVSDGILVDKTILRLHVFDRFSVPWPDLSVLGLATKESEATVVSDIISPKTSKYIALAKKNKNNKNFWKKIISSKYPTIIHGNSSSVVKSINITSNVPPMIKNILIVEAISQVKAKQVAGEGEAQADETQFLPSAVNVSMMGCPMINRASTFFIDFMTGTSLDNLYMANQIVHSISPGDFTTTIQCLAPNQNIVQTTKTNIINKIENALDAEG